MTVLSSSNVVLLAGGVGGARLAEGLINVPDINLSVICNIGDDEEFHGLHVSPDVDTMIYTLSNNINRSQGWGLKNDEYRALKVLEKLGNDVWMSLGDSDFGLHIYRSHRLKLGHTLSVITSDIAKAFKIPANIILPTNALVPTMVRIAEGWISFQEYFVRNRCKPKVLELNYKDVLNAEPNVDALDALNSADIIVFAPSNPFLSLLPILSIPKIKSAIISNKKAPKIAVSPLIAGKAVKGPADKLMGELGFIPDTSSICNIYKDFLNILIVDHQDISAKRNREVENIDIRAASILIDNIGKKIELANFVINTANQLRSIK